MHQEISKFKENQKTAFLATEYERLERQMQEVREVMAGDPAMQELALGELAEVTKQQQALITQMESILRNEEEDARYPNEILP